MFWTALTILDIILFVLSALTVLYIIFFAIMSCFYQPVDTGITKRYGRFLFITTATSRDQYIEETIQAVLQQKYDKRNFEMIVVGDNLTPLQKIKLAQYPITLLCTNMEGGSKGRAQQFAINNMRSMKIFDSVILLDPDEIIMPDFLTEMNKMVQSGQQFFQLHRKPLTTNNDASILSATMEEINNSIFRKGHVVLGMPSALIGSAVCLNYTWFKNNIADIAVNDEEKKLETLLIKQKIFIDYTDHICVYFHPLSSSRDIVQQRKRWMETSMGTLFNNLKQLLPSIIHWDIDMTDKLITWLLIPRIILMGIILTMSAVLPFIYFTMALKWWTLFFIVTFAFALATPDYLVQDDSWSKSLKHAPRIILGSLFNIVTNNIFARKVKKAIKKQ